jgi:NAD(P)-dependent dehydrogenase (short-subunit alcohol dehydrogenase family)
MGCQALLVQGDVGNYDDAWRMAQEIGSAFGPLDILIPSPKMEMRQGG